jgi:hypothetical protein
MPAETPARRSKMENGKRDLTTIAEITKKSGACYSVIQNTAKAAGIEFGTLPNLTGFGKPTVRGIPTEDVSALLELLAARTRKPRKPSGPSLRAVPSSEPRTAAPPVKVGSQQELDACLRRALHLMAPLGIDEVHLRDGEAEITETRIRKLGR